MAYFSIEAWVALSVVCGAGILAILNVLANRFHQEREMHDLRVRTTELRQGYTARLAAMRMREHGEIAGGEMVEAEVVGIAPEPLASPIPMRQAA